MNDFNFFEPFFEEKKKLNLKFIYVIISISFIVLIISGAYLYTVFKVNSLENKIAKQKEILVSKELKGVSQKLSVKQKKLNLLNNYYNIVEKVDKSADKEDKIDTNFIKNISNEVPQKVTFQVMNISDTVNIQGSSQDRNSIGEFEFNLKKTDIFKEVHIANIIAKEEGAGYTFNIICSFKEENNNETK
ncbi:PilN domain-containing protein [Clostridium sp. MB40-C1]|uniref:PilN domain-containing protein n=1 Tax=Clostridium sp. MB40-C1 TaxID=3070996 RepID=UPI0027E01246|nr:PilN domain-containing protein [Clostridium sp. MB40-C1]WMJ80841.1 PilN domain-containing protein [Clostridium sp. MB40-C1]